MIFVSSEIYLSRQLSYIVSGKSRNIFFPPIAQTFASLLLIYVYNFLCMAMEAKAIERRSAFAPHP